MSARAGVHAYRGYCYLSPAAQKRFVPVSAGWRAGADPFASFFGPAMELSDTASRFDRFRPEAIFSRNRELETHLRGSLAGAGWEPVVLDEDSRSTIVRIPLGDLEPAAVVRALSEKGVVTSAPDGALRVSVHLYNDEEDVSRLVSALALLAKPPKGRLQLGSQGGRRG